MEINDTAAAIKALQQNRLLQSEIGSWTIDLTFCSRMLEIYGLKADADHIKHRISQNQHMAKGFMEERLNQLSVELKSREGHLTKLSEDQLLVKDRDMLYQQKSDNETMMEARKSFNELRRNLYTLIEELKSL